MKNIFTKLSFFVRVQCNIALLHAPEKSCSDTRLMSFRVFLGVNFIACTAKKNCRLP